MICVEGKTMGRPKLSKKIRNDERLAFACTVALRRLAEEGAENSGTDLSGFVREATEVAVAWQQYRKETIAAAGLLGMSLGEYIADAIRRSNVEAEEIRKQIQRPR